MLAIIESLHYWCGYLAGTTFVVHTDHKPLEYFFSQPNLSGRQLRWAAFLADFLPGLSNIHSHGKDHLVPDALSCLPMPSTMLTGLTVSSPIPIGLDDLPITQEHDPSLGALFACACHGGALFSIQTTATGDLLLRGGKTVIPEALQAAVIKEMHDNRGHFGQAWML